jgi:hypothetical protein
MMGRRQRWDDFELRAYVQVRELRPRALPMKLLAVSMTGGLVNLPLGAAREHLEKFSPGWFVAVHASIPFVAMLRKAVVMPQWAIVATIASAVAGQIIGARIERHRLSLQGLHRLGEARGAGGAGLSASVDVGRAAGGAAAVQGCGLQAWVAMASGQLHLSTSPAAA